MQNSAFISRNRYPSLVLRIPEITVLHEKQINSTDNYCTGLFLQQQEQQNCSCLGCCPLSLHSLLKVNYAMQTMEQPLLAWHNFYSPTSPLPLEKHCP